MSTEPARGTTTTAAVRERLARAAAHPRALVAAIALLALAVRLFGLGSRVAHQDEARVAYWAYRYMESGVYWYRPIVHGPFLTIVDSYVFSQLGASDVTMRLVVAVVGGLLPLSALLFRGRLRDTETVALALVLAANPLLLYYSRFYRNDLLLAGFMFVAIGCFVRAADDRRPLFVYLGTAAFALGFTTKENALLYPVTWAGAAVLLADRRLLVDRVGDRELRRTVVDRIRWGVRALRDWGLHLAVAVVEFLAIVVFFYAPRGEAATPDPTLGATLADPTLLPALISEATLGSWGAFVEQWGSGNQESYLSTAGALLPALETGALALIVLAVVGFVVDRYTGDRPRDLVAFAAYWGVASALGYPIAVDNPFPWEVLHVVVPLAIPAAVGTALLYRHTRAAIADTDSGVAVVATLFAADLLVALGLYTGTAGTIDYPRVGALGVPGLATLLGLVALTVVVGAVVLSRRGYGAIAEGDVVGTAVTVFLVVLVVGQVGATAYHTSFAEPQSPDNELVQYAQSGTEMKPLLGEIRRAVAANDGTDVLYYGDDPDFDGDELHAPNPASHDTPIAGGGWFERLPFAWYFEAYGAATASTADTAGVRRAVSGDDRPPVVIAFDRVATCKKEYDDATDIERFMSGYERHEIDRFLYDSGCTISSVVVYVDETRNTTERAG